VHEGAVFFNIDEIDEIRFWRFDEIREVIGRQILSDNFENEFTNYLDYLGLT
jgi:hypothetical protein